MNPAIKAAIESVIGRPLTEDEIRAQKLVDSNEEGDRAFLDWIDEGDQFTEPYDDGVDDNYAEKLEKQSSQDFFRCWKY